MRLLGHSVRVVLLLVVLASAGMLALIQNPAWTLSVQNWLADRVTRGPKALLGAAEGAMARKDYAAATSAARQFMASIPFPLPVDAFGDSYRKALRILRESAEQGGDIPAQLDAGRMALAFDPRDTAALFAYALSLEASGDSPKATEVLSAVFAIRPFSAQVSRALEALHQAAGEPDQAAKIRARHLEAVALCLGEKGWLSGNFVHYGSGRTKAKDIQLGFPQATDLEITLDHETDGAYLVFNSLPHLRVVVEEARLNDSKQGSLPIRIDPQQALRRLDERTAVSTNPPAAGFNALGVIGLLLPVKPTQGSTINLRIRIEPDSELEPWVRQFGTWQHPRLPVTNPAQK